MGRAAVLTIVGPITWQIPGWLSRLLPRVNIEGTVLPAPPAGQDGRSPVPPPIPAGHSRPGMAAEGADG